MTSQTVQSSLLPVGKKERINSQSHAFLKCGDNCSVCQAPGWLCRMVPWSVDYGAWQYIQGHPHVTFVEIPVLHRSLHDIHLADVGLRYGRV
jgi:hypothetical protein